MFLACLPTVFLIENDYEILVNTASPGIAWIEIGEEKYYPENCGVLPCQSKVCKIRIPQRELNQACRYTVCFKKTIDKKSYFPVFGEDERKAFAFRPMPSSGKLNIYFLADLHYRFDDGERTAGYFGENTHLFVFGGDLGEADTIENYLDVCCFTGNVTKGIIPCVFARGNHDTRGAFAELYTDYFPSIGKNTYYTFETDRLFGIVLDCGEDKDDSHPEYGGANMFHSFRIRELEFLKKLSPRENKLTFALCHIPPVGRMVDAGGCFDIENSVYHGWNDELERLGISFMLSGHVHRAYILDANDERSKLSHSYPIVVGSEKSKTGIMGTALIVDRELEILFTNIHREGIQQKSIELKNKLIY